MHEQHGLCQLRHPLHPLCELEHLLIVFSVVCADVQLSDQRNIVREYLLPPVELLCVLCSPLFGLFEYDYMHQV